MHEDKQAICDAFCEVLKMTDNLGNPMGNPIDKLVYMKKNGDEYVRPIFRDGTGNNGWYDVCVSCDSGTAMLVDIYKQFVIKI